MTFIMRTRCEALRKLPADTHLSCTFGYPGVGGYSEIHRGPANDRWMISNGPYDAPGPAFDWTILRLE